MEQPDTEALVKVIVGLGNPGEQFARTRHNVGFMAVETLCREESGSWSPSGIFRTCCIEINSCPVLLVEPLIYMNRSGKAVHAVLSELGRGSQDLLLLVDDLNLPFGRIRIRERGSAGGHHGLESIFMALETEEIVRVRMGISEEHMPEDKSGFVLSDFPPEKQTDLNEMITKAGNAVRSIIRDGVSKTMAIYNA